MAKWGRPTNIVVLIGLAGLVELVIGLYLQSSVCLAGGAVAICATVLSMRMYGDIGDPARHTSRHLAKSARKRVARPPAADPLVESFKGEPVDVESLVEDMLDDGRFALLIRPQIIGNLDPSQLEKTKSELDASMCLVPTGPVLLQSEGDDSDDEEAFGTQRSPADSAIAGRIVMVDSLFLDCHPVTNSQYQQFVDHGGYEQLAIWHEESLPAMIDFVDQSGLPGPRFWEEGTYADGEANLPIVGVSWYEACAYARWCGKRLPTDPEWVKAGAWPVESSPGKLTQRRFPWGNTFDNARANIWGSGLAAISDADRYRGGTSAGGASQLIGNVWEWTASPFGSADDTTLRLPYPMKSIRGGAFDTYFENQATCHFQSGEGPLSRRHNIGFRLAIGVCDLSPEATGLLSDSPQPPTPEQTVNLNQHDHVLECETDSVEETNALVEEAV